MKFTMCANDEDFRSVTFEFQAYSLGEVLDHIKDFLTTMDFEIEGELTVKNNTVTNNDSVTNINRVMDWTTKQILRSIANNELCSVCKLSKKEMKNHTCWDAHCPC